MSYQEDAMQKITGTIRTGSYKEDSVSSGDIGAFKESDTGSKEGLYDQLSKNGYRYIDHTFDSSFVARTNTQNETVMKNVAVNFIIKAR